MATTKKKKQNKNKNRKKQVLVRMEGNWNTCILLLGMQNNAASMKMVHSSKQFSKN